MAGSPANHAPEMVPDIQEHLTLPHPHLFKKNKIGKPRFVHGLILYFTKSNNQVSNWMN